MAGQKKMASFNKDMVDAVMQHGHAIIAETRVALDAYASAITAELDTIQSARDSVTIARHAIVFSVVSPQCPFERNVKVTPVIVSAILNNATQDELRNILSDYGIGLQNAKALSLATNAEFIRNMTPSDIERSLLMVLRGVNMKVSAMTIALTDRHAPVYTLDTHMLKGLARIAGLPVTPYTISPAQYRRLEAWLVELMAAAFPDVPTFVTQWALWNMWGFNAHKCHLGIFGL